MKLGNLKLFDPINREHDRDEFLQQSDQIMKTNGLKPKPKLKKDTAPSEERTTAVETSDADHCAARESE
jgi:hypothetical protein